jgi:fructose-1-phosphate kinase PfkB-like protein
VEGETRASLSVADLTGRGLTEFYERAWDIGAAGWEQLEGIVRDLLPSSAWMTLSGNLPVGAPDDGYARLIRLARTAAVPVALDARAEALLLGWRMNGDGRAAIVTRGAEGAVVVTPGGVALRARLYERGRYPVGSGDAFLGGLVTALEGGATWADALAMALGAAAANADVPGAGRLDRTWAVELSKRAEVRTLD